jgi:CBS domain-containing protein
MSRPLARGASAPIVTRKQNTGSLKLDERKGMMTLTSEIMTPGARCIGVNDSLSIAAALMSELDVGALPICGEDGKLKGMLTDRDIVVKAVAEGLDPETTPTSALASGHLVTVNASDDVAVALAAMQEHQLRRLPVLEDERLVGIVSQADVARSLSAEATGETVESISRAEHTWTTSRA